MNTTTSIHQEEAIARADVLTCCRPPAVAAAVAARVVAHGCHYLLYRLEVRQGDTALHLTIHGHLHATQDTSEALPVLIEHVTIAVECDTFETNRSV